MQFALSVADFVFMTVPVSYWRHRLVLNTDSRVSERQKVQLPRWVHRLVRAFVKFVRQHNDVRFHSFQSINVSHFIMNLRQVFLSDDEDLAHGSLRTATVRFAAGIAGNVGAPLQFPEDDAMEELQSSRPTRPRSVQMSDNPLAVGLLQLDKGDASYLDDE